MDFNKYKNLLIQKIKNQLSMWFDRNDAIKHSEVYRFLHSLHGSAGTLQLVGLHQLSGFLLNQIKEDDDRLWNKVELQKFLEELIRLTDKYESFAEKHSITPTERRYDEKVPVIQIIDDDISMLILL